MKKIIISVLGKDRPGIVHTMSKVLFEMSCNIRAVSQTTLQTEFAGIFLAGAPDDLDNDELRERLETELKIIGVSVTVKDHEAKDASPAAASEPFVITLRGGDKAGIIPGVAGVIAGFNANIENLRAITMPDTTQVLLVFEVAVPMDVHRPAFREALKWKAEEFGMELGVQHREIFEAIHRVQRGMSHVDRS